MPAGIIEIDKSGEATMEILVYKFADPPIEIHPSWVYVGETWDRWIYRVPVIL